MGWLGLAVPGLTGAGPDLPVQPAVRIPFTFPDQVLARRSLNEPDRIPPLQTAVYVRRQAAKLPR